MIPNEMRDIQAARAASSGAGDTVVPVSLTQTACDSPGPWAASLMCSHALGGRHGWVLRRWPGACFSDPGSETFQKDRTQAIGGG